LKKKGRENEKEKKGENRRYIEKEKE